MGNSSSHIKYHKAFELREKQHLLFYDLQTDKINFNAFRVNMMKCYNRMGDTSFLGYHTLLKNGHLTDKESALGSKYEFNCEVINLDPFPIGYFNNYY